MPATALSRVSLKYICTSKCFLSRTASTLSQIFKSPRQRAQKTFELLFQSYKGIREVPTIPTETTDLVQEWDYGKYEGITSHEIHERYQRDWNIFKDGCGPEGETIEDITKRVDKVIEKVKSIHASYWERVEKGLCKAGTQGGDVLIVTHGHFSKCFLARWCEMPLQHGTHFIVDAGGCESFSTKFFFISLSLLTDALADLIALRIPQ